MTRNHRRGRGRARVLLHSHGTYLSPRKLFQYLAAGLPHRESAEVFG